MRAAIRQLERADLYLAAVERMAIGDGALDGAMRKLRADLEAVRRYVVALRTAT